MSFYPIFIFSTPFICFWGRKQNCGVEKNLHIIIFILSQIYYDLSQDKNNLSLCVSLLETFINILLLKSKRPNVVRIVEWRVGFCYLYYISLHKKSKCFIPFLHLPSILLTSSYIHSPQMATCRDHPLYLNHFPLLVCIIYAYYQTLTPNLTQKQYHLTLRIHPKADSNTMLSHQTLRGANHAKTPIRLQ